MNDACPAPESANSGIAVVDFDACRKLAAILRSHRIPEDHEDSSLRGFTPAEIGNLYLFLVATSHQTSPQDRQPLAGTVGKRLLRGWDYLTARFEAAARLDRAILSPDYWEHFTAQNIRDLFRDELLGERLSDPEGRSALIRDLGRQMLLHSWSSAKDIYDASGGYIDKDETSLLSRLARFRAYRDPVHKKSFFFLALMRNTGLWKYKDPGNLGAPIDYHEVRGHLRIGTVQIQDLELSIRLMKGEEIKAQEDIEIRRAVHSALMLISEWSGLHNPSQLHYLFWNVFRSCCTRENPHCHSCPPNCSLPARYVPLAIFPDGTRRCPFSNICESANREPKLLEPRLQTDYY